MEPAGPAQRGAHARRRHDARPVHGLPRLGRDARTGRHPGAERDPAWRDVGRRGDRDRCRQPDRRQPDRRARVRLGVDHRVVDDRGRGQGRAAQPRARRQRDRQGRLRRQLRRAQELAARCRLEAGPHELPRRHRGRRARQYRCRFDHRELRRHEQARHDHRRRRVHRRRHDDRGPARHREGRPDRRGCGRHDGRAGRQAGGRRARAHPRAPREIRGGRKPGRGRQRGRERPSEPAPGDAAS